MSNGFVIRYGTSRLVGEFTGGDRQFSRGDEVIVRSSRGVEWGEVLCPATEKTREYLGSSDSAGRILRPVNEQDVARREEISEQEPQQFAGVRDTIAEHTLQMQLVDIEHLFGGERLIIYYLAEQRVDFRQLVKALAKQFKTRIEMRQIGVRDEAKLLADYGDCGKPVCCNTHLREMPPVAMKMAKIQKATLDPTKISGRCGRLKCCLRYEYDTYEEYRRELPRVGATVVTKEGQGRVVGQEILARKVLVVYEDQRRMLVDGSSILTVIKSSGGGRKENASLN
jgi:cell fate regulator YaaT (PSP1 superfamily)